MMFTLMLFGLAGAINGGVGILDKLRAATDHMVELRYRERTGKSRRRHVRLDLDVTPEEMQEIARNTAVQRGVMCFAIQKEMGEIDCCKQCGAAAV